MRQKMKMKTDGRQFTMCLREPSKGISYNRIQSNSFLSSLQGQAMKEGRSKAEEPMRIV